jgi:hypothetical protein
MQFYVAKCKVMHFGRQNPKNVYTMSGQQLEVVESERDIGVDMSEFKTNSTVYQGSWYSQVSAWTDCQICSL